MFRRRVRRDKEGMEQDQMRPLWSGEESGGTRKEIRGSGEASAFRRDVKRDKEGMEQDQERPAFLGEVSGGTRKVRIRIL